MNRRRPLATAAALLLLAACAAPLRRVPQPEGLTEAHLEAYQLAAQDLDHGRAEAAVRRLEPFAEVEPWHVPTHVLRQDALRAAERVDEATTWYAGREAAAPDDAARVLLAARLAPDAVRGDAYERAMALDPGSPWARIASVYELLRARRSMEREAQSSADDGDPEAATEKREHAAATLVRAEALADEAVELAPDLAAAHGARVEVLFVRCRLAPPEERPNLIQATEMAAVRSAELAPADPAVLQRLALALYLRSRDEDAVAALRKALEIAPEYHVLHADLGRVLLDLREDEEALAELTQASVRRPADVDVLLNLGVARFRTGDLVGARAAFVRAGELAPRDPRPFQRLATVDYELGRAGAAVVE